jgi:hypothetical protein
MMAMSISASEQEGCAGETAGSGTGRDGLVPQETARARARDERKKVARMDFMRDFRVSSVALAAFCCELGIEASLIAALIAACRFVGLR